MIGGLVGRPVACSTGPGRPTPTPARSRDVAARLVEELAAVVEHPPQHDLGPERDVEVDVLVRQHGRRQVGDGEPHVGRADVGGQDRPGPTG